MLVIFRIIDIIGFVASLYIAINKNSSYYKRKAFFDRDMHYKEELVDSNRIKFFVMSVVFLMIFAFSFIKIQ
ncbi:hypothetical protein [Clostridium polynesiense]|uniref:hypothetical protein n=1 Tax=Clostridium polynesiense TaxID=1325933 RepID=UPI00058C5447|nr:hypothetical protein [Clostridium polynesiense]